MMKYALGERKRVEGLQPPMVGFAALLAGAGDKGNGTLRAGRHTELGCKVSGRL